MNPFEQKPKKSYMDLMKNWKGIEAKPYDKLEADPYTKARIILMNGIEVEAALFGHNFHRHCEDNDLRREIALCRRMEQMQQKHVNWLSPSNETTLELTIGYEQLAVDLTAWLAMHEPDEYSKACMDFALLEDFDHLYRYANLLKIDEDIPAHKPRATPSSSRRAVRPSPITATPPTPCACLATPRRPTSAPRWAP